MPRMTAADWKEVEKYFNPMENWGDPSLMAQCFIRMLVEYRKYVARAINVHCGYDFHGHLTDSLHGQDPCSAADLHVEGMHVLDMFFAALRFGFDGIGIYPCWNNPGLHVEINHRRPHRGIWWRYDYWGIDAEAREHVIIKDYRAVSENEIKNILRAQSINLQPKPQILFLGGE